MPSREITSLAFAVFEYFCLPVLHLTNAFTSLFTGNFGLIPNLADDLLALAFRSVASAPYDLGHILTYMFTHFGFRHILFNMIVLYFSGKIFMEYLGEKRMLALYIYGGYWRWIFCTSYFYNISPILGQGSMVGASAGCIAVLVAGALYMPQMPVDCGASSKSNIGCSQRVL
jgi:membrane associated rhomboid family serine protease